MKPTDDQILKTLEILEHSEIVANGEIDNKYNGYCAAFGGVVVKMGLLQAVMLYQKDDRKKINEIIFEVYKSSNEVHDSFKDLFMFLKDGNYKNAGIRNEIVQIATALKMALRTYKLKDND